MIAAQRGSIAWVTPYLSLVAKPPAPTKLERARVDGHGHHPSPKHSPPAKITISDASTHSSDRDVPEVTRHCVSPPTSILPWLTSLNARCRTMNTEPM